VERKQRNLAKSSVARVDPDMGVEIPPSMAANTSTMRE
jgi:hypothetical protein